MFRSEGYKREDGTPLQFGDALPSAYTVTEANSLKSFSNQLYGYYSHETKWLLNSYFLGATFTQFKTYWSSLKNRYLLKPDTYSQGH